jgi:DNA-binding HxlR family transcriptional regulator
MLFENPLAKPWQKRNSSSQIPKSEAVATRPVFRCRYRDQALSQPWMSAPVLVMQFFLAAACTTFTIPNRPQVPCSSLRFSFPPIYDPICFISLQRYQEPNGYLVTGPDMSAKRIASKCPIEHLLVLIGGRWKPVILWWLSESRKPLRFKILRENMPRISQKVLTQQLRELEQDELVKRQMFPEMPVRVEYSLTPFGTKLRPVLRVLDSWSRKHVVGRKSPVSSISL